MTFWSPFNAFLALVTLWIAASTSCFEVFAPCVLFRIVSALLTAFVYASRLALSASVKLTLCLTVFWSWIACSKLPICVFNSVAAFLAAVTSLTWPARSICDEIADFWLFVKCDNVFKFCLAVFCAFLKFSAPFKPFLALFTCVVAWVIALVSIVGLLVWLMIPFAFDTALLYVDWLFGLASV